MIKNGLRFNGFYSKNYLPKIKDRTYVINLDESKSIRKSLDSCNRGASSDATYFDSFGVEHMPKEIWKLHKKENCHKKNL